MAAAGSPRYGVRYEAALADAARLHAAQMRKSDEGSIATVPYVAHLLEVSSLVWQGGGDEDSAVAGLLHDALEDQPDRISADEIELRYGRRVREIVEHCTDGEPGGDRGAAGWLERKVAYLLRLRHDSDDQALLVTVADKVSNAGSILEDIRQTGGDPALLAKLWGRFKAGAEGSAWYYAAVAEAATRRMPDNALVQRLAVASQTITRTAGGTDVIASLRARWPELDEEHLRRELSRLDD